MSSFFKKMKAKTAFSNKTSNKRKVELPPDFFEQILACEIQMKKGFSMSTLQKLIAYYSQAVEYFESVNDKRYEKYSRNLQILLTQPEVMKHINMQTEKGKIKVRKQERKKEILDKLNKVDKLSSSDKIQSLLSKGLDEEKKEGLINDDINKQKESFKKRMEEKKKKWQLSTSDIGDSNTFQSKGLVTFSNYKNINKSFDDFANDTSGISFDVDDLGAVSEFMVADNNSRFTLTEEINDILDVFFNKFESDFNSEITSKFIEKMAKIHQERIKEELEVCIKYNSAIKDKEFLLTFDENMEQSKKESIEKEIEKIGKEHEETVKNIRENSKKKINELREEFKSINFENLEWVKNIKENYSNNIESSVIKFVSH